MADTFGAITIPLDPAFANPHGQGAPATTFQLLDSPSTDPTLGVLLAFLVAWLNKDQNAQAAWNTVGIDPAHPPVQVVRFADPRDVTTTFEPDRLPALYAWRDPGTFEQLADDWETELSTVKILWILPIVMPEDQQLRRPFFNGLAKTVYLALSRGRTPSWVVIGDTDTLAPTQGSWVGTFLQTVNEPGYYLQGWRPTTVTIKPIDGSTEPGIWPAVEFTLQLREKLTVDITDPLRFAPTSALNGDDMTIVNPATDVVQVEGYLAGTPVVD